jgi:hypothetical protein
MVWPRCELVKGLPHQKCHWLELGIHGGLELPLNATERHVRDGVNPLSWHAPPWIVSVERPSEGEMHLVGQRAERGRFIYKVPPPSLNRIHHIFLSLVRLDIQRSGE